MLLRVFNFIVQILKNVIEKLSNVYIICHSDLVKIGCDSGRQFHARSKLAKNNLFLDIIY